MSQGWAVGFTARARAHWTPERTRALLEDKALLLLPGDAAPLLRAIGLLDRDGAMPPDRVRKYRQINHMVTLLTPALAELRARHPVLRVVDAGCGRSYLSLLLAWCGRELWGHTIEVLGVDRSARTIASCQRRAALVGLDAVTRFVEAPLGELDVRATWSAAFGAAIDGVHALLALHACDTATCDAIALGVAERAALIAVAPCCQAELARRWSERASTDDPFAPAREHPHLRRELAAHLTDTLRGLLLRAQGYQVSAIEFVPSEHTRKNTLIRALDGGAPDPSARAAYRALVEATGGDGLALASRLPR